MKTINTSNKDKPFKGACRFYTSQNGSKTIYIKKELAELIPFLSGIDYLVEYDPTERKITITEL